MGIVLHNVCLLQSLSLEDMVFLLDMEGEGLCLHSLYTEGHKTN